MSRIALKRTRVAAVRSQPIRLELPGFIAPCLARHIGRPPSGANWAHEIKHDGFRTQVHVRNGNATIYSRNGHDWTDRYATIAHDAAKLPVSNAIFDGEAVVPRVDGTSDYWTFQSDVRAGESGRMVLHAFDILYLDGEDVRPRPFIERKELLRELIASGPEGRLLYTEHTDPGIDGTDLWAHAH